MESVYDHYESVTGWNISYIEELHWMSNTPEWNFVLFIN